MLTLPDPSHTIIILSNSYSRSPRRKLGNKRAVAILNTNQLTCINIVFVTNTNMHYLFLHVRRLTAQNRGVADLKPVEPPVTRSEVFVPISTANIAAFSCKRRPVNGMFFANFRRPLTPPSHSSMTFPFPAMMLFICVFPTLNSAANFRELSPFSCNLITLTLSSRDKTTRFLVAIFETHVIAVTCLRPCFMANWPLPYKYTCTLSTYKTSNNVTIPATWCFCQEH